MACRANAAYRSSLVDEPVGPDQDAGIAEIESSSATAMIRFMIHLSPRHLRNAECSIAPYPNQRYQRNQRFFFSAEKAILSA